MDQQDAVIAHLHRLDRRMKRIGATAVGLMALALFTAMAWQQDPQTVAVQNVVRAQRLELTNAEGEVVAVLSAVNADPEIVTGYYDHGAKRFQARVRDNNWHGKFTRWDVLGRKMEEGDYRNGLRHGLWVSWDSDEYGGIGGQISRSRPAYRRTQGAYADGVRTGIWTEWHSGGEKYSEGEYDDDQMAGNWRFWNDDGSIDQEQTGFYENGVKIR